MNNTDIYEYVSEYVWSTQTPISLAQGELVLL